MAKIRRGFRVSMVGSCQNEAGMPHFNIGNCQPDTNLLPARAARYGRTRPYRTSGLVQEGRMLSLAATAFQEASLSAFCVAPLATSLVLD